MRRSRSIQLSLVLAAAAACTSRECVDAQGVRIDPAACAADAGFWRTTDHWNGRFHGAAYRGIGSSSGGGVGAPSSVERNGFGATGAAHPAAS